jgi:hypothetical protein
MNWKSSAQIRLLTVLAGTVAAASACGSSAPAVNAPPASPRSVAETAATRSWLAATNQMWTKGNFAALTRVTTGEAQAIYQTEQQQAGAPAASRKPLQLTGLSITIPCHAGPAAIFVAYGDTDVFTLGQDMQPFAMIFQRTSGAWKLAAVVRPPAGGAGWPALCTRGSRAAAAPALTPAAYAPELARVLSTAMTGRAVTSAQAVPFAVNGFLAGSGSVTGQAAQWIRQDRKAGVGFTGGFAPAAEPTFALPLASGHGYWLIGFLTQTSTHISPSGYHANDWPDGSPLTTPRLASVHHQTDTFITTYAATDPAAPAGGTVTLDGFFGWQLATTSS